MERQKISKRLIAHDRKEKQIAGATFLATSVPLVTIGTIILPGIGTVAGLLCAGAIATIKSRRYATTH